MTVQRRAFASARADAIAAPIGIAGLRERLPHLSVIVVSGALSVSGTSSAEPARLWEDVYVSGFDATASGFIRPRHSEATDDAQTTQQAIFKLRRISGLTWEQLGELFGVSRRSVHFWASGKPLNAGHQQRLMQILDVVRAADRGDARATRAALLDVKDGVTAFALLAAERYEEARAILGGGAGRPGPALAQLSAAAKTAREPLPPEDLVDAQHARVHRDPGRARPARTLRNKRRGTP